MEPSQAVGKTTEETGQAEPKKFLNRFQIIEAIKELDDSIENVSLNLIKCDFNATEDDVRKAYPDFKFLKVKNYHPGSWEIVLPLRIDAINFVKNSKDIAILSRRPIIKMGRNFPVNEDAGWTLVEGNPHPHHHRGNHGYRKHDNYKKTTKHHTEGSEAVHGEHKVEAKQHKEEKERKFEKPQAPTKTIDIQPKPELKRPVEPKPVVKEVTKPQQTKTQQKSEPAGQYKPHGFTRSDPKVSASTKTEEPKVEKKTVEPVKEPTQKPVEAPKKQEKAGFEVKQPKTQLNKPAAKKPVEQEKKVQKKTEEKKVEKKEQPKEEKKVEPPKPEDDGWIFVEEKRPKKKKN